MFVSEGKQYSFGSKHCSLFTFIFPYFFIFVHILWQYIVTFNKYTYPFISLAFLVVIYCKEKVLLPQVALGEVADVWDTSPRAKMTFTIFTKVFLLCFEIFFPYMFCCMKCPTTDSICIFNKNWLCIVTKCVPKHCKYWKRKMYTNSNVFVYAFRK